VETGDASSWTVPLTTEFFRVPPNDTYRQDMLVAERLANEGRYTEAIDKLKRVLAPLDRDVPADSYKYAYASGVLGEVLYRNGNFSEALSVYFYDKDGSIPVRSLRTFRNRVVAITDVYIAMGNLNFAETVLSHALKTVEARAKEEKLSNAPSLMGLLYSQLALVHALKGSCDEAEKLLKQTAGYVGQSESYLKGAATCAFRARRYADAFRAAKRGLELSWHQPSRSMPVFSQPEHRPTSGSLLELALASALDSSDAQLLGEAFELTQRAHDTTAGRSLLKMAARHSTSIGESGSAIRELQDLQEQFAQQEQELLMALGQPEHKRIDDLIRLKRAALEELATKLEKLNDQINKSDPAYFALINERSVPLAETRNYLREDEALELLVAGKDSVYAWLVTAGRAELKKLELRPERLGDSINAIRCGLDARLWDDATDWPTASPEQIQQRTRQLSHRERCQTLLDAQPASESDGSATVQVLPFSADRAHDLYRALLAPFEKTISGKRLIIVPSGVFANLPLNVLVTERPVKARLSRLAEFRRVAWLGTRTSLTVLPSVAALKALRGLAKPSGASKSYLGVGNPLLEGAQGDTRWGEHYRKQAALARAKRCSGTSPPQRVAALAGPRGFSKLASMARSGQANIEHIRLWTPLPETADELCDVGHNLGAGESDVLLGANATEARVKDLSESGRLAEYRIVHFATHGALTGEVLGSAEPGLILTPPAKGTEDAKLLERDDGFLSASEVAALKLDADWVILSACNTAGGQYESAETLSGMARAFFYAGARALLVSNWEVGSQAAVKLTTGAFAAIRRNPATNRAEALRVSIRELVEKGTPQDAHPSMWAPFILVGEGAARDALAAAPIGPKSRDVIDPAASSGDSGARAKARSVTGREGDWRARVWERAN
jgi:CHAT domain-containing protein